MDGRTGGRAEGRTDGRRTGGEFIGRKEKGDGEGGSFLVVEVEFGIRADLI